METAWIIGFVVAGIVAVNFQDTRQGSRVFHCLGRAAIIFAPGPQFFIAIHSQLQNMEGSEPSLCELS